MKTLLTAVVTAALFSSGCGPKPKSASEVRLEGNIEYNKWAREYDAKKKAGKN